MFSLPDLQTENSTPGFPAPLALASDSSKKSAAHPRKPSPVVSKVGARTLRVGHKMTLSRADRP
jgi:hypothetical protein